MKRGIPAVFAIAAMCLSSHSPAAEVELERPAQTKPATDQSAVPQAVLNVKADGKLLLGDKPVADLPKELGALAKIHKDYAIVIRGDENVSYKEVVRVLDTCRDAGIWNVSFAVTKTQ